MSSIIIADQARIPAGVDDLESFRRWARSMKFPKSGWYSFLDGEIWVDANMEQLITHNLAKTTYTIVVGGLVESEERGYFFSDRALLSNTGANLCTEPDGTFVSFASLESGKIRFVPGKQEGFVEIEGTPDMTLEVVSRYSVRKDKEVLPKLYWQAGIPEYWLVDVRKEPIRFDILRHTARGYVRARRHDGWIDSKVFGRAFRLETKLDRQGHPRYQLKTSGGKD